MALTQQEIKERAAARHAKWWPAYYEANKEKIKARTIAWQLANPDKKRAKQNKWNSENRSKLQKWQDNYRKNSPSKYLFGLAKRRANRLGRTFNIELSDVIVPKECPLLGIPINSHSEHVDFRPSLDRIDSSRGYEKGNVMIISHKANRLKGDANGDELMTMAINLLRIEGKLL